MGWINQAFRLLLLSFLSGFFCNDTIWEGYDMIGVYGGHNLHMEAEHIYS